MRAVQTGGIAAGPREPFGQGDEVRPGGRSGAELHGRPQLSSAVTATGTPLVTMS